MGSIPPGLTYFSPISDEELKKNESNNLYAFKTHLERKCLQSDSQLISIQDKNQQLIKQVESFSLALNERETILEKKEEFTKTLQDSFNELQKRVKCQDDIIASQELDICKYKECNQKKHGPEPSPRIPSPPRRRFDLSRFFPRFGCS